MFEIKEMNLYKTTNRFLNNYNHLKKSLKREPTIEEMSDIDQLHYNGIEAVNEAIFKTNINKNSLVLDIGSGIGGPARYITSKTNSTVYAIEIQKELNYIAKKLTFNYKLNTFIHHIFADILTFNFKELKFDSIVSWLALYHIPDRTKLLKNLYKLLNVDGHVYVEDFYLKKNLSSEEKINLSKKFHANHLVNFKSYQNELINNKFQILEFTDMSENWTKFTKNRLDKFKKNYDRNIQINDKVTTDNVLSFYELAFKLLSNEVIGGIKYVAKKK
tara:strand:+ start:764 stop:1585 length:822 start_codon:yes stop_codon:yes gene_type:complete